MDCSIEGLCETIGEEDDVPFDDRVECDPVVCPGDDDGVDSMPGDTVQHSQGTVSQTCSNAVNMKDELCLLREPSGEVNVKEDDDHCTFKR